MLGWTGVEKGKRDHGRSILILVNDVTMRGYCWLGFGGGGMSGSYEWCK